MPNITIQTVPQKGRGVVATTDFNTGDLIEICPVIVLPEKDAELCDQTILGNYIYEWTSPEDGAVVLGYGSIYNHSFSPNAQYYRDFTSLTLTYKAIKPIKTGEEITVNYNGEPDDSQPIDWIEVV